MPVQPVESETGPVRVAAWHRADGPAEATARAWLASRLAVEPAELPLARDARGRPCLDRPGWDCNWSHGGPWLLVALGAGVRVGVDVEVLRPRPKALEVARRYFAPDEAERLAALDGPARDAAFLRLWCAKEAVLKAHGRGLVYGLHRVVVEGFDTGDDALRVASVEGEAGPAAAWRLRALALDGAVAALAWRGTDA